MIYVIESIKRKDGGIHTREYRRKGHRVEPIVLLVGFSMVLSYVDDDNDALLRTSIVERIDEVDGLLTVTTQNSVYTLRREDGDSVCVPSWAPDVPPIREAIAL